MRLAALTSRVRWMVTDKKSWRNIDQLKTPTGRLVHDALRKASRNQFSSTELQGFQLIESLRKRMTQAKRPVEMIYYGVGGPTKNCSPDQISRGVLIRETTDQGIPRISAGSWKGRLLYCLVHELAPQTVLELGTGYGVSGMYQILALKHSGRGVFHSIDASEPNQQIARELYRQLGYDKWNTHLGRLEEALPALLTKIPAPGFAYLDADHSYEGTVKYTGLLLQNLQPDGLMVLDDIHWSDGMNRAWRQAQAHPHVAESAEYRDLGIIVRA